MARLSRVAVPLRPVTKIPFSGFAGGFNILNVGAQWVIDTGYPKLAILHDGGLCPQLPSQDLAKTMRIWWESGSGRPAIPGTGPYRRRGMRVETDSVISMFTLSDFGRNGGTNVQGPIAKIDYMLLPRLTLTAKGYFVSLIDRPKGMLESVPSIASNSMPSSRSNV